MADVVIVDDDQVALQVIQDALREAGHAVRVAETGTAMMQLLLERPCEVLILDVNMPEISGDRLAKVMRKSLDPPYPKVLLFSGLPASDLRRLARKLGVTGWVRKGSPKAELLRAVAAAAEFYRRSVADPDPEGETQGGRRAPEPLE